MPGSDGGARRRHITAFRDNARKMVLQTFRVIEEHERLAFGESSYFKRVEEETIDTAVDDDDSVRASSEEVLDFAEATMEKELAEDGAEDFTRGANRVGF